MGISWVLGVASWVLDCWADGFWYCPLALPPGLGPNCKFSAIISVLYCFTPAELSQFLVFILPSISIKDPLVTYFEIVSANFPKATILWNSTSCFFCPA